MLEGIMEFIKKAKDDIVMWVFANKFWLGACALSFIVGIVVA